MADIYIPGNPAAANEINVGDPTTFALSSSPALSAAAVAGGQGQAALSIAQALTAAALASASAAAAATLRQSLQASGLAVGQASAGLSVTGGNAKCITKPLMASTMTTVPQQLGVKWVAVNLATTPPSLVAAGVDGDIDFTGRCTVQHPALQVGTIYAISGWTADGFSFATKVLAEGG